MYIHSLPPPSPFTAYSVSRARRGGSYPPEPYSISWTLGDFHGSCGLIATINDMELPFLLCVLLPPPAPTESSHFHFGARNISAAAPSVLGSVRLDWSCLSPLYPPSSFWCCTFFLFYFIRFYFTFYSSCVL